MNSTPKKAPYGTWTSPINAEDLTASSVILESVLVDDVTNEVYHIERRPSEAGRSVLVRSRDRKDTVGQDWNVRTGVHGYGGGAATVSDGIVYFSHYKDGRVYRVVDEKSPEPVTPESKNLRYADFTVFRPNTRILISALEDHSKASSSADVVNKLVVIDTATGTVEPIAEGADFYSSPAVNPDGTKLAWIQWHHPNMPWEGSELVIAEIVPQSQTVAVKNPIIVAGRKDEISISQPRWMQDGRLIYLDDRSGFVNPWVCSFTPGVISNSPIFAQPIKEDFASPGWLFGYNDYAILDSNSILFASTRNGHSVLALADLNTRSLTPVPSSFTVISYIFSVSPQKAVFLAKKHDEDAIITQVELEANGDASYTAVASTPGKAFPREIISKAQPYALPIPRSNGPVHVLFYPPHNPAFEAPDGELPPAIFSIHGGPTSRVPPGLDWAKQYWTTRGWAWVDVNYGGSSGYGKEYRDRLRGNWGIVDVNDTVEAVKQLAERGVIDPKRTAIRGGSAGGYTVLACLVTHPKVFAAGTSLYGVSDLRKLCEDTHKFESHYLEKLVGGTPEEIPDVYKERSPISHADKIETPLLILQGSIDTVVPPSQAEMIVDSINKKGGRVKYILFDGEGHGWRKAENIKRGLEAELGWYESVFGFDKLHASL